MGLSVSRTTDPLRFDVGIGSAGYADVITSSVGEPQKALMPAALAKVGLDPTAVIAVPVLVCRKAHIATASSALRPLASGQRDAGRGRGGGGDRGPACGLRPPRALPAGAVGDVTEAVVNMNKGKGRK